MTTRPLQQVKTPREESLETALVELVYAINKVGDWPAETRVGQALENAEILLYGIPAIPPSGIV